MAGKESATWDMIRFAANGTIFVLLDEQLPGVFCDAFEMIRQTRAIERRLLRVGLRAEREELFRLSRNGRRGDEILRKLVREIDLSEARLGA